MLEQINTIQELKRKISFLTIRISIAQLQNIYKDLNPFIAGGGKIREAFNDYGFQSIPIVLYDWDYAFLDADTIESLAWDLQEFLQSIKYKKDLRDCDDYAYCFASLMSLIYSLNCCGAIYGEVFNTNTEQSLGKHYFNIVVCYDKVYKKFGLYLCDPLNPGFVRIEKGKPMIINDWKYKLFSGFYF